MIKKFTHNVLGWGYPDKETVTGSDLPGASGEATCICGEPIIKDRGGWYHPNWRTHTTGLNKI